MKNKFINIYLAMMVNILGAFLPVYGQSQTFKTAPASYSPQAEGMIQYDNTPVQMYTGRIGLSIPVSRIEDKDFNFPLSISYNSAGFRPAEPDNYVGRNWSLNTGGVVYRTVRGIPDDIENYFERDHNGEYSINGFMKVLGNGKFNMNEMKSDIRSNPYKYGHHIDNSIPLPTIPNTNNIEASPDIFHFSFGKHTGKFMINYDGTISVVGYNGGKYEVDLSKYEMLDNVGPYSVRISIKTDDGYVYTFGGEGLGAVEYTALNWGKDQEIPSKHAEYKPIITAWYLTGIKAPNGRMLTVHYKDIEFKYHKHPEDAARICKDPEFKRKQLALSYLLSGHANYNAGLDEYHLNLPRKPNSYSYSLTKVALVDSISTECWSVKLHYSERKKYPVYDYLNQSYTAFCGAKLDSVITQYSGNISAREKTVLNYDYKCADRMFLTSLHHSKTGKYQFDYYNSEIAGSPSPMTINVDHWNFWRGRVLNTYILPALTFVNVMSSMDYTIASNDRDATGDNVNQTLLHKITYPTGGKTEFVYEPNKYTSMYARNADSYYLPLLETSGTSKFAGGARIQAIRYYQSSDKNPVKETRYQYDDGDGGEGVLQYMPFYSYLRYYAQDKVNYDLYGYLSNSDGVTAFSYPSPHITYPYVSECYIDTGKGGTEAECARKVTGFTTDPDRYETEFLYKAFTFPDYDPAHFTGPYYSDICNRNMFIPPSHNLSHARGKIASERYFDKQNELVREVYYQYAHQYQNEYSLCIYHVFPQLYTSPGLYTHVGKEYFGMYLPKERWVFDYTSNGIMRKKEFYEYDKNGYLKKQSSLTSSGDSLITTQQYLFENSASSLALLTDKKQYLKSEGKEALQIGAEHYNYRYHNSSLTGAVWPVVSEYYAGTTDQTMEKRVSYLKHDCYGNPVSVEKDGVPGTYIWGYNGRYLVARIENATYGQVAATLRETPEVMSSAPAYETYGVIIENLCIDLPQAHIFTYTYKPGTGMASSTDPTEKSLFYEYDLAGRLIETSRTSMAGDKEILQLNKYHLVNE